MKTKTSLGELTLLSILVVVALTRAVVAQDEPAHSTPIWLGTEVSISPDPGGEGLWHCEALLKDLTKDEVLSAPSIVFAAGEAASVQSGLPEEMLWELEVEVGSEGQKARWSSEVTAGDQVLSLSTGAIRLAGE